jgi:hypothetical protein
VQGRECSMSLVNCEDLLRVQSPREFSELRGSMLIEQEMARRLHSDLKMLVSMLRSVARRRLMKTDNPSACAVVNWKVYKSVIALYLRMIKRICNRNANKSNHPN